MSGFKIWPKSVLPLAGCNFIQEPFSRTGGTSLENVEITTQTDVGKWRADIGPIIVHTRNQFRVWTAIRTYLSGRSGIIAMPANEKFTAPYVGDVETSPGLSTHSDGSTFSDGSKYRTRSIGLRMSAAAGLGATVVSIEAVNAGDDLTGVRFSYQYALYETGELISRSGNVWQVRVFPAIRQAIPAGADLEADDPMCLMKLETDIGMQLPETPDRVSRQTIRMVEAVDYWNDLAVA